MKYIPITIVAVCLAAVVFAGVTKNYDAMIYSIIGFIGCLAFTKNKGSK